ncbi:hypothetical protein GCM10017044_01000 [Kordiimonas sediminis]|uniref:Uncharacterized protein n=1 Tax=Kordiimonas sediminis TaxID=1735581 RepID=A0A919AJ34_9PROT|nr:hypothetical protein [Kordiimonas sediminis]GHF11100.1 hypothetical protein GCM10017044_01000 [Kordiimonas sediminis]
MKTSKVYLFTCALLAGVLPQSADEGLSIEDICSRPGFECLESEAGTVIGKAGATASYAHSIDEAAAAFERYFGKKAPKAALVLGEVRDAEVRTNLLRLFPVVLPWMTLDDRRAMVERSVRAQVQASRPDLKDEALEKVVAQSVEASLNARGRQDDDLHHGILAHELGHMFFMRSYYPDQNANLLQAGDGPPALPSEYGSPAPDWMDEMSAVLLENAVLTESRYGRMTGIKTQNDFTQIWSFEEYLTMGHPALAEARKVMEARRQSADAGGMGGVVILNQSDMAPPEEGPAPVMFYSQSRAFADYMIETTGNVQIFAEVAAAITQGKTVNEWLDLKGEELGLPSTIDALEKGFQQWFIARERSGR